MALKKFKLIANSNAPIDGDIFSPNNLAGKNIPEILNLETWLGKKRVKVSEIFEVTDESNESEELTLVFDGNITQVTRVGKNMSEGKIIVKGSVGAFLGIEMSGGSIDVDGDADTFVGMSMKGGTIQIKGNAGDAIGSGYWGSRTGMLGGLIIVQGNAGDEIGRWMKAGTIRICGNTGILAGSRLQGGSILIQGNSEGKLGASMVGGKVVLLGKTSSTFPSFHISEIKSKAKIDGEKITGPFYSFLGDIVEKGAGKLFISVENNPDLKYREDFIP